MIIQDETAFDSIVAQDHIRSEFFSKLLVLIGVPVRSPNGAHDNGDRDNEEILARNSWVGCFWDGRSRHGC